MLLRILAIAHNTFREAARDRVPLALFGSGLGVGMTSLLVAAMSLGRDRAEVVGCSRRRRFPIFRDRNGRVGATSLYKDLERKTIFPISRAIHRHELLIGKHLGSSAR